MMSARMHNATDAADAFAWKAKEDGQSLTHLQLMKLAYIAHGYHLAVFDQPLIGETVEAWKHGPVFRSIYRRFREHGAGPVPAPLSRPRILEDEKANAIITAVWQAYGQQSGGRLSSLTHNSGTPWDNVARRFNFNIPDREPISQDEIKRHYLQLLNATKHEQANAR